MDRLFKFSAYVGIFYFFLAVPPAFGAGDAGWFLEKNIIESAKKSVVKKHIARVIAGLQKKAVKAQSLEYFGKITMAEGAMALEAGGLGVEFLSFQVKRSDLDWKVKYWIADILGYIHTDDSRKVLRGIIGGKDTPYIVRKKASESIRAIGR